MSTANLGIGYVTGAAQHATQLNVALDQLDAATAGVLEHDFDADADYTLDTDADEHLNLVLYFTDTGVVLSTGRDVIVPSSVTKVWYVKNDTAQTLTVRTEISASSGVAVSASSGAWVRGDGTDVVAL